MFEKTAPQWGRESSASQGLGSRQGWLLKEGMREVLEVMDLLCILTVVLAKQICMCVKSQSCTYFKSFTFPFLILQKGLYRWATAKLWNLLSLASIHISQLFLCLSPPTPRYPHLMLKGARGRWTSCSLHPFPRSLILSIDMPNVKYRGEQT